MSTTEIGEAREKAAKWYYKEIWGWDIENLPTGEQPPTFLKAQLIAANGDGILTPEEKQWVIGRAAVAGIPEALLKELETYEANEDIVEMVSRTEPTNKHRKAVIYFAVKACAADGDYHDEEKKVVRLAATAMGISSEEVEEIEKLCAEEERLKEKRAQLCFPDGSPFPK